MCRYAWAWGETDWYSQTADSIEEYMEDALYELEDYGYDPKEGRNSIVIGEIIEYVPTVDVVNIIEGMIDNAYDQVENLCVWEDALFEDKDKIEELSSDLNNVLYKWLDKNNLKPSFFIVDNIKEYEISPK